MPGKVQDENNGIGNCSIPPNRTKIRSFWIILQVFRVNLSNRYEIRKCGPHAGCPATGGEKGRPEISSKGAKRRR
jgi:hypothetical protein